MRAARCSMGSTLVATYALREPSMHSVWHAGYGGGLHAGPLDRLDDDSFGVLHGLARDPREEVAVALGLGVEPFLQELGADKNGHAIVDRRERALRPAGEDARREHPSRRIVDRSLRVAPPLVQRCEEHHLVF